MSGSGCARVESESLFQTAQIRIHIRTCLSMISARRLNVLKSSLDKGGRVAAGALMGAVAVAMAIVE